MNTLPSLVSRRRFLEQASQFAAAALVVPGVARAAPLFFEHDGSRGVRDGNWKLVSTVGDAWELYNLASDPTEMKNLAGVQPERVRDLAAQWTAWAKRTHVDPTTNPFTAGPGAPKQKKAKGKAE